MRHRDRRRRTIRLLIIVVILLVAGFALWVLYQIFPTYFPNWFGPLFFILTSLGLLITVLGAALSDILLPLWDRLRGPETTSTLRLSDRAPIRQVSYDALIERLGRSGKIPWVDRGVTSTSLLRTSGRVAIVGLMKSGKTREAAELIRVALQDGLISVVYEPTSALDLIDQDTLAQEVGAQVEVAQCCLFYIDELGLRTELERLERLSTCIQSICKIRPDTYFLITIQRERLTSTFQTWLEEHNFSQVTLPPLSISQRHDVASTGAAVLGVAVTAPAIKALADQTDGRPYSIVFALQQASGTGALTKANVHALLARGDEEAWAEQRRQVIGAEPSAGPLLESIATFVSAGVTPRESSIRHYARYLMTSKSPTQKTGQLLDAAAERWSVFDIVAAEGLYTIPEPLVLPLLLDTDEARAQLKTFAENYDPGRWMSLALIMTRPLYAVLGLRGPRLLHSRFIHELRSHLRIRIPHPPRWFSRFFNHLGYYILFPESLLKWPADRAFLLLELGSPLRRTQHLSMALLERARLAFLDDEVTTALDYLDRALALNNNNTNALGLRGSVYQRMALHEKALADFNAVLRLEEDRASAIAGRGVAYRELGHYEKAIVDFDRAAALGATTNDLWTERGLALSCLGRYSEAIESYEQSLKEGQPSSRYIPLYNIAVAMARWKGVPEAQAQMNVAYALLQRMMDTDARGDALYGLGGLAALEGKTDQALDYLQQAKSFLGEMGARWARHDIAWLDLHNDTRFQSLVCRISEPER
jgi:tetratricopeptide (TPR) repeat protein